MRGRPPQTGAEEGIIEGCVQKGEEEKAENERTFDTASLFSMHVFQSLYGKRMETEIASKAVFLAFVKFLLHIPSSSVIDAPVPSEPDRGRTSATTSLDQFKSQAGPVAVEDFVIL